MFKKMLYQKLADKWQDLLVNCVGAGVAAAVGSMAAPFFIVLLSEIMITLAVRVIINKKMKNQITHDTRNDSVGFIIGNLVAPISPVPLGGAIICSTLFWAEDKLKNKK